VFKLVIHQFLELLVNVRVFQLVLIFVFKPDAVSVYEVDDGRLPNR
jgi:hypothetical protein